MASVTVTAGGTGYTTANKPVVVCAEGAITATGSEGGSNFAAVLPGPNALDNYLCRKCVCVYLPVCQSAYTRAHTSTQILSVADDAIDRVVVTNAGSGYRGTITLVLDVYASCVYHDLQPQPSGYVDTVTVLSRWMLMLVFGCGRACLYSCVAVVTQIWCSAAVLGTHRRRDW